MCGVCGVVCVEWVYVGAYVVSGCVECVVCVCVWSGPDVVCGVSRVCVCVTQKKKCAVWCDTQWCVAM